MRDDEKRVRGGSGGKQEHNRNAVGEVEGRQSNRREQNRGKGLIV